MPETWMVSRSYSIVSFCFRSRVIDRIDQSEFEGFEYVNPLLMSLEDCVWQEDLEQPSCTGNGKRRRLTDIRHSARPANWKIIVEGLVLFTSTFTLIIVSMTRCLTYIYILYYSKYFPPYYYHYYYEVIISSFLGTFFPFIIHAFTHSLFNSLFIIYRVYSLYMNVFSSIRQLFSSRYFPSCI